VDTVGFIALDGLFTSHVTGNLVLIGAVIAGAEAAILSRILAIPVFAVTVAACSVLASCAPPKAALVSLLAAQAALLLVFAVLGITLLGNRAVGLDADSGPGILAGMAAVCAMAIQNACGKLVYAPAVVPTTVMTGNTTQLFLDAADAVMLWARARRAGGEDSQTAKQRFTVLSRLVRGSCALLSFVFGALAGSLVFRFAGFWSVLVPVALVAGVLLLLCRHAELSLAGSLAASATSVPIAGAPANGGLSKG
jgi:uncharacterized membrane protein YoaK (UPF0700 family)